MIEDIALLISGAASVGGTIYFSGDHEPYAWACFFFLIGSCAVVESHYRARVGHK
jgi:hypothetical protein